MPHEENAISLLNLACGRRFLPGWTNLDLIPASPEVIAHDLTRTLPFPESSFDGVYHSHVLEHMEQVQARSFLNETIRVLKPGAVLRAVVPDLEEQCRNYLATLDALRNRPESTESEDAHAWNTLELLDQMVRLRSGGEMIEFVRSGRVSDYVRNRLGDEWGAIMRSGKQKSSSPARRLSGMQTFRKRIREKLEQVCLSRLAITAEEYRRLRFSRVGEVHRWMYDEETLSRLLRSVGYIRIRRMDAFTSTLPRWEEGCWLDVEDGKPRKPGSLYLEGCKP